MDNSAIAAAVTPVVMISSNAILIGAISAKHQGMGDRVRTLTAEWRNPETTPERRIVIRKQIRIFQSRFDFITVSHMLLYQATGLFILMVIAVALGESYLSLTLLLIGVALTFIAIVLELIDLGKARASIRIETEDVLNGNQA